MKILRILNYSFASISLRRFLEMPIEHYTTAPYLFLNPPSLMHLAIASNLHFHMIRYRVELTL